MYNKKGYCKGVDMLEFNKKYFKELIRDDVNLNYKKLANILTNGYGISTTESTIKSWMVKTKSKQPEYAKISAMADYFGVPSLYLFTDGEKELEKNIRIELSINPDKYTKYIKSGAKSSIFVELVEKLETLSEEQIRAVEVLVKGIK